MVLDRKNKIIYAAKSERTHQDPLLYFSKKNEFQTHFIYFNSNV